VQFSVLVEKLKLDVADDTLGWFICVRAFERAVVQFNKDLSTSFAISGAEVEDQGTLSPDSTTKQTEGLLLLAEHYLAQRGQIVSSDKVSWKSGDKSVDRSRQSLTKRELCDALWAQYLQLFDLDKTAVVGCQVYEPTGSDGV